MSAFCQYHFVESFSSMFGKHVEMKEHSVVLCEDPSDSLTTSTSNTNGWQFRDPFTGKTDIKLLFLGNVYVFMLLQNLLPYDFFLSFSGVHPSADYGIQISFSNAVQSVAEQLNFARKLKYSIRS